VPIKDERFFGHSPDGTARAASAEAPKIGSIGSASVKENETQLNSFTIKCTGIASKQAPSE
jgi:hypothetical protein